MTASDTHTPVIATIGYEGTTVERFLRALTDADVELLIDVRAVARSRRPGFAKTALAANLETVGIDYLHLRGLGTPPDGRAAARAGRYDELREIYSAALETAEAQADLASLVDLASRRRVCLMCFEADHTHCHRSLIIEALEELIPFEVRHLDALGS